MIHRIVGALLGLALVSAAAVQPAQAAAPKRPAASQTAPKVIVQHIKVHSPSLAGNLEGNAVDRDVIVVLPPSYAASKARRYPVLYFLHGFVLTAQSFSDFMHVPDAAATSAAHGAEFIIVVPDSDTKQGGAMYSSSPTTGDFESFIAKDLVSYIDGHYRTIAKRASRGLVGHSMGGYGVWKIAMKYPQQWSTIYAMSACCVSPRTETVEAAKKISETPFETSAKADFGTRAALASAVAWSPAPDKPPYYADFAYKDGAIDQNVLSEWAANAPLAMVPQYVPALKSFNAIAIDVGDKDGLIGDDTAIHNELTRFGVKHQFEVYDGNHFDHIMVRFPVKVLPFFAQHLVMK